MESIKLSSAAGSYSSASRLPSLVSRSSVISSPRWKRAGSPFVGAWYPSRTGWVVTTQDGRAFILRALTKGRTNRSVYLVREVVANGDEFAGLDWAVGLGLAFGLDHARRMITRFCLEYPMEF